jgi:hypothetical protein
MCCSSPPARAGSFACKSRFHKHTIKRIRLARIQEYEFQGTTITELFRIVEEVTIPSIECDA